MYWDNDNEYSVIQLRRTNLNLNDAQLKDKLNSYKLKFGEPFYFSTNHYLIVANADNQTAITASHKFKEYKNSIIDCSVFFNSNSRLTLNPKTQDVVQLIDDSENNIYCINKAENIKYGDTTVKDALDNMNSGKFAAGDYRGGNALGISTETPTDTSDYFITGVKATFTQNSINKLYNAHFNSTAENNIAPYGVRFNAKTGVLKGAAWNDYAECRVTTDYVEPGRVVIENGDDTLSLSTKRMQPAANVVSDTYGFIIGETDKAKVPMTVAGRVLVYPFENKNTFMAGDVVCSGPNGTISKMTREEIKNYPECIIGVVSAIPTYMKWNGIDVNGRIWIKIK